MRISQSSAQIIKQALKESFGEGADVFLFGSRVDDLKKGGDIDLFVTPNSDDDKKTLFDKRIRFLSRLQAKLEDQSIDVVVSDDKTRSIEAEALRNGIKL